MKLTADYHTHTKYSDAETTVLENVRRAKEIGLKEIAITEHGYSHWFYGIKRKETEKWLGELEAARRETGMTVLAGMENNIRGISGLCDFTEKDYEKFDIYLAGVHSAAHFDTMKDWYFFIASWWRFILHMKPTKGQIRHATQTYIRSIERNPIDILTHLNHCCFADVVEVAKCCRDYGTYLEISAKKQHLTDDELCEVAATGVRFVVNSDAHSVDKIGDATLAEEQIARVGIPLTQIDNIDGKKPRFRFAEYKKHM